MLPDGDSLYHTYNNVKKEELPVNYEERLIPKEIDSREKENNDKRKPGFLEGLLKGIEADDLVILLLILLLKNEKCEDNTLLIILLSLLLF